MITDPKLAQFALGWQHTFIKHLAGRTPVDLHPEHDWLPGQDHDWTPDQDMKEQGLDPSAPGYNTLDKPLFSSTEFPGHISVWWYDSEENYSYLVVCMGDSWVPVMYIRSSL